MTTRLSLAVAALALLAAPLAAFAAATGGIDTTYISAYSTGIIKVINSYIVPVIFTLALLVFLWGVAKAYIISANSDSERAKGHQLILWGIIGFVVMLSVWGLVNIVQTIFGLSNDTSPTPPTLNITG